MGDVLPSFNAKNGFIIVLMVLCANATHKAAGQVAFFLTCKLQLTTVFLDQTDWHWFVVNIIYTVFALYSVPQLITVLFVVYCWYAVLPHRPLYRWGRCGLSGISSYSAVSCDLSAMQLLSCPCSLILHSVCWNRIMKKLYTSVHTDSFFGLVTY